MGISIINIEKESIELTLEGKIEFQKILKTLISYYLNKNTREKEIWEFRKIISEEDPKNFQIFVTKIGNHEFDILCLYKEVKTNWLHIDGIVQERETLKGMGIFDNPVYQITCLTDILNSENNMIFEAKCLGNLLFLF